jgi:hypothetical protein
MCSFSVKNAKGPGACEIERFAGVSRRGGACSNQGFRFMSISVQIVVGRLSVGGSRCRPYEAANGTWTDEQAQGPVLPGYKPYCLQIYIDRYCWQLMPARIPSVGFSGHVGSGRSRPRCSRPRCSWPQRRPRPFTGVCTSSAWLALHSRFFFFFTSINSFCFQRPLIPCVECYVVTRSRLSGSTALVFGTQE